MSAVTSKCSASTGYLHPNYAHSLAEFGNPRLLPGSGGWLLERPIPGLDARDAMACYPLLFCRDWRALHRDLKEAASQLVSVCVVTDPLGDCDLGCLRECFPNLVRPFKEHFVVDLSRPLGTFVSRHHRLAVRRAFRNVRVEPVVPGPGLLDEWTELYVYLIRRHRIRGLLAFSRQVFDRQLAVPGLMAFRARQNHATVGMVQWVLQDERAYLHLTAYNPAGYAAEASYAALWFSLECLSQSGIRLANLGGGAGVHNNGNDGLSRFKRGWSNQKRTAYLGGRVFDQQLYEALVAQRVTQPTAYFPAYRAGEFN